MLIGRAKVEERTGRKARRARSWKDIVVCCGLGCGWGVGGVLVVL